jgi:hypothetical protein
VLCRRRGCEADQFFDLAVSGRCRRGSATEQERDRARAADTASLRQAPAGTSRPRLQYWYFWWAISIPEPSGRGHSAVPERAISVSTANKAPHSLDVRSQEWERFAIYRTFFAWNGFLKHYNVSGWFSERSVRPDAKAAAACAVHHPSRRSSAARPNATPRRQAEPAHLVAGCQPLRPPCAYPLRQRPHNACATSPWPPTAASS